MFEQRPFETLVSYAAAMIIGAIGTIVVQQYISFKLKKKPDDQRHCQ